MSYIVLARKYRPAHFDEVIGQDHITELLKKSITSGKISHAYLFCGPRGIGKTSCARILSKCLNCKDAPTLKPCGKCPACREITLGNSFDVIEIDGASNRGIDEIRTIRENVKFAPGYGHYKIYIVDEVHMLTTEAFNALLKTLEEPPEHVKFIFATTDPNKLPATILSRCQRYDFKRIPLKVAVEELTKIAKKEKIKIDADALYAIAKASGGSFRDSLSILDQVSAITDHSIQDDDIYAMLGLVEIELLFELTDAIAQKNCSETLKVLDKIIEKGKDIKQMAKDLIEHFRNLMILKVGGKSLGRLLDYPISVKEMYLLQSKNFPMKEILKAVDLFIEAQEVARITESFRTPLEIAFAKLTYDENAAESIMAVQTKSASAQNLPEKKFSPVEILKNKKGQVKVRNDDKVEEAKEEQIPELGSVEERVDIEGIKKAWSALTYAVSQEKISIATYLQEGFPVAFEDEKLTIGFSQDLKFYKETLEDSENISFVERIFGSRLKTKVIVAYKIIQDYSPKHHEEDEPVVKKTLETFRGKIVSKWHN